MSERHPADESSDRVRQLADALEKATALCTQLIALTEREQDALVSGDGNTLTELVSLKRSVAQELGAVQTDLDDLARRMCERLAPESSGGLNGLRAILPELSDNERALLEGRLDALDRQVETVATRSRTNALLLRHGFSQARSIVDLSLGGGGRSYSPNGEENTVSGANSLFNYHA